MRRVTATLPIVFSLALLTGAAPARCQELTIGITEYQPFGIDDLDGDLPRSAEVRVTFPRSARTAIELFVTYGRREVGPRRRLKHLAFFGVQLRRTVARVAAERASVFITYGLAAACDSSSHVYAPIGHFGAGLRMRLAGPLAIRPEIQVVTFHVVPIGVRMVIGGSIDLR